MEKLNQSGKAAEKPENEILPAISEAQTFEDLFAALDEIGELKGSRVYTAGELKEDIGKVRLVRGLIGKITRAGGLRDKVAELLEKELETAA